MGYKKKKMRLHFNEFMIKFHDSIFKNKDKKNGIENFVKDLSTKTEIIYFDEFQVTNIVDAMILGKLFKRIFEEKIKVMNLCCWFELSSSKRGNFSIKIKLQLSETFI